GDGGCRRNLIFFAAPANTSGGWPRYFKSFDTETLTMVDEVLMPEETDDFCACGLTSDGPVSANGGLYYFGNHAQRYDGSSWTPVDRPEHARRSEAGIAYLDGRIYVVSGRTEAGDYVADLNAFDPATGTWTRQGELAPLPFTTSFPAVGATDGELWVYGKHVDSGAKGLAYYDPAANRWTTLSAPGLDGDRFRGIADQQQFLIQ